LSSSARAEWSELAKEPEAQYFFDKRLLHQCMCLVMPGY
jgi:hypothetical protein